MDGMSSGNFLDSEQADASVIESSSSVKIRTKGKNYGVEVRALQCILVCDFGKFIIFANHSVDALNGWLNY